MSAHSISDFASLPSFHRTFLLFGAIRGDRAAIEFRGYSPSAVEQLKQELGDKITVQQPDWNCGSFVEIQLGDRQLEQDRPSGIVTVMPVLASGMGYAAI